MLTESLVRVFKYSCSNRIPMDLSSASVALFFQTLQAPPFVKLPCFWDRRLAFRIQAPFALSSSSDSPLDSAVGIVVWVFVATNSKPAHLNLSITNQ
ncbi:hypothetical protein Hanom_Chr10g00918471 [Helianthus anomalus]